MKDYFPLLFSLTLVVAFHLFGPVERQSGEIFQTPPLAIVDYSFDYDDLLSTILWVRVLQDMEVCDQKEKDGVERTQPSGVNPIKSVLETELPPAKCEFGWVYNMVDVVTELDPSFRMAYFVGGLFLTVLVDDRLGASAIYEKGIRYFPDDWEMLYSAAYNELFELKQPKKAAELLIKAGNRGAPPWVYSLAGGLYTEIGQAQFAKTILESVLERNPKGPMVERIQGRLDKINKLLQEQKAQ